MPKAATIKDIAREAGVSPSLVSFVFNGKNRVGEETRRRILEVADRLGYRAGQAARVPWPAAHLVGVIVPSLEDAPLQELSDCAYRRGYTPWPRKAWKASWLLPCPARKKTASPRWT